MAALAHRPGRRVDRTRPTWWLLAGLAALVVAVVVLGVARWNGVAPFGSDNDEYRLVAEQLLDLDAPVVAGVEGTKYPLGYPAVLAALDAVGLPMVDAALVLNVVLVGVAAALAGFAVRHRGAAAVVVAAAVVLLARPLWHATQSTMPDVAFTAVVAGAAVVAARRHVVGLTVLVLAAAALKSVGVLVGLAATASLLWRHRGAQRDGGAKERVASLVPAAAGLGMAGLNALVVGRYAEHTTGYARTFRLEDPYDAARGDASLLDVALRLPQRIDLVLDDAARALWGDLVHGPPAWLLTLGLIAAAVAGARNTVTRVFLVTFVALDLVALSVWPYSSVRFGLPVVPIAAIGAGYLASRLRAPERIGVTVAAIATAVLVAIAVPALDDEAERESGVFAALDAARRDAAAWLPPDAQPVSPDYRELATVLPRQRAVLPISYTSDAGVLLAEAKQGTHLVVLRGLYGGREAVAAQLLAAHGDHFQLVHQAPHVDIYAVLQ